MINFANAYRWADYDTVSSAFYNGNSHGVFFKTIIDTLRTHLTEISSNANGHALIIEVENMIDTISPSLMSSGDKEDMLIALTTANYIVSFYDDYPDGVLPNHDDLLGACCASWRNCAYFGLGLFGAFAGGPAGAAIGMGTMIIEAGPCEEYLTSEGYLP